jgi:hypothetical protein
MLGPSSLSRCRGPPDRGDALGDEDSTFVAGTVKAMVDSWGLKLHKAAPGDHATHGVAERSIRTLSHHAAAYLHDTTLPPTFWAFAMSHAAYIWNRLPSPRDERVPAQLADRPDHRLTADGLKPFGCLVTVFDPSFTKSDWAPRACLAINLGKDQSSTHGTWLLLDLATGRLRRSRAVRHFTKIYPQARTDPAYRQRLLEALRPSVSLSLAHPSIAAYDMDPLDWRPALTGIPRTGTGGDARTVFFGGGDGVMTATRGGGPSVVASGGVMTATDHGGGVATNAVDAPDLTHPAGHEFTHHPNGPETAAPSTPIDGPDGTTHDDTADGDAHGTGHAPLTRRGLMTLAKEESVTLGMQPVSRSRSGRPIVPPPRFVPGNASLPPSSSSSPAPSPVPTEDIGQDEAAAPSPDQEVTAESVTEAATAETVSADASHALAARPATTAPPSSSASPPAYYDVQPTERQRRVKFAAAALPPATSSTAASRGTLGTPLREPPPWKQTPGQRRDMGGGRFASL